MSQLLRAFLIGRRLHRNMGHNDFMLAVKIGIGVGLGGALMATLASANPDAQRDFPDPPPCYPGECN